MKSRALLAATGLLLITSATHAQIVSGVCNNGAYCALNVLTQWQFGAASNTTRWAGSVNLGVGGLFDYDIQLSGGDVATLSDRRVVITHQTNGPVNVVSVLQPLYDRDILGGGVLTGLTVVATYPMSRKLVAPLPKGGFVCVDGTGATIFRQTGPNAWSSNNVAFVNDAVYQVAGLIHADGDQFVVGHYNRRAYRYSSAGLQASYTNNAAVAATWGAYSMGEGLRNNLLVNGWLIGGDNDWGNLHPTVIMDGTETGGGVYMGVKGRILNSDGTDINTGLWTSLADGRVLRPVASGWMQSGVTWSIYTLIADPPYQPLGSIGAASPDFQAYTPTNFVGVISGDYMFEKPKPQGTVLMYR